MPPRRPPKLDLAALPLRPRAASPPPRMHPQQVVLFLPNTSDVEDDVGVDTGDDPRDEVPEALQWDASHGTTVAGYLATSVSDEKPILSSRPKGSGAPIRWIPSCSLAPDTPLPSDAAGYLSVALPPLDQTFPPRGPEAMKLLSILKGTDEAGSSAPVRAVVLDVSPSETVASLANNMAIGRRRTALDTLLAQSSQPPQGEKADIVIGMDRPASLFSHARAFRHHMAHG